MMNLRRPFADTPAPKSEFASIEKNQCAIAALSRVVSGIIRQDDVSPAEPYPISHVTIVDCPAPPQPASGRLEPFDQDITAA